jgi:hypothetical protein
MQVQPQISFQQALDVIESFPDDQQHDLITIVQKRLIGKRLRKTLKPQKRNTIAVK